MNRLSDMLWIEFRKAFRSRMPLWTSLGSLFMPLGVALLIFLARNPELSRKLGLISAKADLMAYSVTDWPSYLGLFAEIISAGGFFFFVMAISWVFGREFADGTLKDMLAVPVQRASILLAKFIVTVTWCVVIAILILVFGLLFGALIQLPGGSNQRYSTWQYGHITDSLYGYCSRSAIFAFRQRGARLFAANGGGSSHADHG